MEYAGKVRKLKEILSRLLPEGLCVAFSGGVDSAVLLCLAEALRREHGLPAGSLRGVLFATQLHPPADEADAKQQAEAMGVPLEVARVDEFSDPAIMQNPPDRCYRCKRLLFQTLWETARKAGLAVAVDGTNYDDLSEYRPGLRALRELEVRSPLAEAEMTKEEVRHLAKEMGLAVSRKPSSPCMATRLPYGDRLTPEKLRQAAEGEELLKQAGFPVCRLRVHENLARIEILPADFGRFGAVMEEITGKIKNLGFDYVTLDLEGFRSGSMDEPLRRMEKSSQEAAKN